MTVGEVLFGLIRHPIQNLVYRWNWKSAVTSSILRAGIFFSVNLSAGLDAALAAMILEFVFRAITSGFYGAITQSFREARPIWAASITAMVVIPVTTHAMEFMVHWFGGTKKLAASILASTCFSALSTLFNLFAMRRGVMIVGDGRHSLIGDLIRMPRMLYEFTAAGIIFVWKTGKALFSHTRSEAAKAKAVKPQEEARAE
jgi:hypothetical protein